MVLMAPKESRGHLEMKEQQGTEETWVMKGSQERKDRQAHQERPGTKDQRVPAVSQGLRASQDSQDPGACRVTGGRTAYEEARDPRAKDQQIHTSNKSA